MLRCVKCDRYRCSQNGNGLIFAANKSKYSSFVPTISFKYSIFEFEIVKLCNWLMGYERVPTKGTPSKVHPWGSKEFVLGDLAHSTYAFRYFIKVNWPILQLNITLTLISECTCNDLEAELRNVCKRGHYAFKRPSNCPSVRIVLFIFIFLIQLESRILPIISI